MPDLAVGVSLVLYREVPQRLRELLTALAAQTVPPDQLLVRFNEPREGALDSVRRILADSPVPVHLTDGENIGFSAAHNAALRELFARGFDAVVVHNPDLELAPDALEQLAAEHSGFTGAALLGPLLERAEADGTRTGAVDSAGIVWTPTARHQDRLAGAAMDSVSPSPVAVRGLTGACLWVGRAAYDVVTSRLDEFFDEDFIAYREDADLGLVCEALGVPQRLVPAATGQHVRSQRGTARGASAFVDMLGVRNRFLIAQKHGRHRPGVRVVARGWDAVVVAAVLLRERSSFVGLRQAWALRSRMHAKRHLLYPARPRSYR